MVSPSIADRLLRPPREPRTRIFLLARHAPVAPDFACPSFPGDGGYPAYYHRVWRVLSGLGYPVRTSTRPLDLLDEAGDTDLVFSLYNRMPIDNPEVFVAALCESLHLAHIGAKPNIRALAEDKWLSKLVARSVGLPVAEGAIYARPEDLATPPKFPGPYFVKNRFGAASEGVSDRSIQGDWAGAAHVAEGLMTRGMAVLVEAYAPGIDITVPVLGGTAPLMLGVVRPGSDRIGGIITEDLKRDDPLGYELFEAGRDTAALAADAEALWAAAGPIDYLRLDYRFDPATGRRTFLEFNICCHIGRSGAICLAAAEHGLSQADVLGHVVEASLRRQTLGRGNVSTAIEPGREVRRWVS
jgi:D-alanine-D-alanine ligase